MSRWNIPCVLVLAAFARGQDAAPVEEEPVVQDSAPAYDGSFAEGMGELRRLAEEASALNHAVAPATFVSVAPFWVSASSCVS